MKTEGEIAVCGIICSDCEHLAECGGCKKVSGSPFWTEFVDAETCPVYECCVGEHGFEHCGQCPNLICERFTRYRDPAVGDDELAAVLAAMKHRLIARRRE
ncbi:DUF3795 domain-containing protein [Methanoculleus sp. FWC-SCC1]|uniref:DUF3795 domain-containing protein n=1 Tax=Methanoculleus frigidifontis TaxID=2584085 RepID=A0ABT8M9G6_9EURY|nr:DUF3795 domain-containing protein [Methanoculleus sp. FWC-SCC1]MDN7024572.1 DUF3795 domain-containing protein [Methanoculleus sp. FWC-SCC1]